MFATVRAPLPRQPFGPSTQKVPRALHDAMRYLDQVEPRASGLLRTIELGPTYFTIAFEHLGIHASFGKRAVLGALSFSDEHVSRHILSETTQRLEIHFAPRARIDRALATHIQAGVHFSDGETTIDTPCAFLVRSYDAPFDARQPVNATLILCSAFPKMIETAVRGGPAERHIIPPESVSAAVQI